jgi:hypothetical protein
MYKINTVFGKGVYLRTDCTGRVAGLEITINSKCTANPDKQ